jgi:hypothetical protein
MPVRLDVVALLRVSDQGGRTVRSETLPIGTDLRERLRIARDNYQLQGWRVGDLRPGQWAFVAERGTQRLMVVVRPDSCVTPSVIGAVAIASPSADPLMTRPHVRPAPR